MRRRHRNIKPEKREKLSIRELRDSHLIRHKLYELSKPSYELFIQFKDEMTSSEIFSS